MTLAITPSMMLNLLTTEMSDYSLDIKYCFYEKFHFPRHDSPKRLCKCENDAKNDIA